MRSDLADIYGQDKLPRYTSYPTAPHFSSAIGEKVYRHWLRSVSAHRPVSLYLHIPFCRSMCWYCGCHTSVAKHDEPIAAFVAALRREAQLVADTTEKSLPVAHLHFGGGTPTIMAPQLLVDLADALRYVFFVLPDAEIAVEVDPRTLTNDLTQALEHCGVTRASLGVQSFDPRVQRTINRLQSFEQTAAAVERLRRAGVRGINFDLLYGLPFQTVSSCLDSIAKCVELRPDRLSVFGYAHVPSFKKHQRKIAEESLPDSVERHVQSETIAEALQDAGYVRIGLDHFALPDDALATTQRDGRLRRNFQGYTDDGADTLIGLGASAIGRMPHGFVQNVVAIRDYLNRIAEGRLATVKGYAFTEDDLFRADIIERIMCDLTVDLEQISRIHHQDPMTAIVDRARIDRLLADGVATMSKGRLTVSEGSEFLVRSVASAFDAHLSRSTRVLSRAV
ncbi:oxygen-independent coproporphyrinogen III oxidase [Bradyrhizobium icense]|uniref:Coproporphyrinogen-III oxidase n=1 Tax=Bradyrhizobium icense TaxID=1274631 RepID=A0A1B1UKN8_9BRAD|nr:oxygen-independent coproporphyrinogen III oxidase [Bradyrhizobium icense]ANW03283.1 oxygen-independent coproporphyrinogen III oxidase [Bradyrhizobium icense]